MCQCLFAYALLCSGEIVTVADQLSHQLEKDRQTGQKTLPFDEVVYCNIGNPQQLGQVPITFTRQVRYNSFVYYSSPSDSLPSLKVLALTSYPDLLKHEETKKLFAVDAIERAKTLLHALPGGSGAYSHSAGVEAIRKNVAEFIKGMGRKQSSQKHTQAPRVIIVS